jgi:hypothetical protein
MFNHQYDFKIDIPKEVITKEKHDHIFEELFENKSIIGLCGYGKSGKDYIAKTFIDKYHYHRVAFADNIKLEMNEHLKGAVYNYLANIPSRGAFEGVHDDVFDALLLEDMRTLTMDDIDFLTEDIPVKKRLRPFIIWYGEQLREINGPYYWINQAFKLDAAGHDKIILSDVRRLAELEVFENSNAFNKRTQELFASAGCFDESPVFKSKSHSTLLFHVNQLGLTDKDSLTHDCVRVAQEKWMFDGAFYVDPRLPESGFSRSKAMSTQLNRFVNKFGLDTPDKTVAWDRQEKLF